MGFLTTLFNLLGLNKNKQAIVAFNHYISEDYIPRRIECVNNQSVKASDVFDLNDIAKAKPEFNSLVEQCNVSSTDIKKRSDMKAYLLLLPDTKTVGETVMSMIMYNTTLKKAIYFLMQNYKNCYSVYSPSIKTKSNITVDSGMEFGGYCIQTAMKVFDEELLKTKTQSTIPDASNLVVRFNYYYAFEYIPKCIDEYNNGRINIKKCVDFSTIIKEHPEYNNFIRNISYEDDTCIRNTTIRRLDISIPNNNSISEVIKASVLYDDSVKKAICYTMEKSFGEEYVVCIPKSDGTHSLVYMTKTELDFNAYIRMSGTEALKEFINKK